MDILIECARVDPDRGALGRAAGAVEDWTLALASARRHGLLPLLHWRLSRTCADLLPPDVSADLARSFHANTRRNLMMAAELRRVFEWLGEGGVEAITFKGPTLAALAYGNLGLREFSDLDLLVRPRDRETALSILERHGCRHKGAAGACDLGGNSEIALATPGGCEVDLHWTMSPPYFLPFDSRRAWQRVQRVALVGARLPTFGADDLFACLALHGARHCWASLGWISDVAHLLSAAPPDWDVLLAGRRTRRVFRLAALLAADLLHAPVHAEVTSGARRDPAVVELEGQVRRALFDDSRAIVATPAEVMMHLRMEPAVRHKARYLWRRALQPNQTDNDFLPLPRHLRPVLWIVRPMRMLAKLASGS